MPTGRTGADRMSARPRSETATRAPLSDRFGLFADCLIVGLLTAVTAAALLTAYPALVAACAVLRERVASDGPTGPRRYWSRLREVVASGPASVLLVPPAAAGVLAVDALAVAAGVPGRGPLLLLLVTTGSLAAVTGLRAAAIWRPGLSWPPIVRTALRAATADPAGSFLLWFAAAAAAAIAVAAPVTVLLVAGPLALAAVAVDGRPRQGRDLPGGMGWRHWD